jgi:hypothetical protein
MDVVAFVRATSQANETAESVQRRVDRYNADEDRDQRVAESTCKTCWYHRRNRMCTSSYTKWLCGVCMREYMHHNGCVPTVCKTCAEDHALCRDCGGDLRMRERRRKWPQPSPV